MLFTPVGLVQFHVILVCATVATCSVGGRSLFVVHVGESVHSFCHWQVHVHGPDHDTTVGTHAEQRYDAVGTFTRYFVLSAHQQVPFTVSFDALQFTVAPPFIPIQSHTHGPDPETVPAIPVVQRSEVGSLTREAPLEEPQMALFESNDIASTHALSGQVYSHQYQSSFS